MWGFQHKGAAPHSSSCECRFHIPPAWPRSLTWPAKSHHEGSHVGKNRSLANSDKRNPSLSVSKYCSVLLSLFMFMIKIHHGSWPLEASCLVHVGLHDGKFPTMGVLSNRLKLDHSSIETQGDLGIPHFKLIPHPCGCQWITVPNTWRIRDKDNLYPCWLIQCCRETLWDRPRRSRDPFLSNSSRVRMDPSAGHVFGVKCAVQRIHLHSIA